MVSGIILLLASCNDGSKGISGNRIQDSREYSAEDSLIKKTAGDTILPTGERGIRPEQTAGKNAAADLQNFRKRTVSKYFTGMEADSLSVGRAELMVTGQYGPCENPEHYTAAQGRTSPPACRHGERDGRQE